MNKLLLLLTACSLIISGCRNPHSKSAGNRANDSSQKVSKEDISVLPDTAMLSLKMAGIVSIQDLLSQRWEMEDADRKHWDQFFWDSESNKRKYPGISLFRDFKVTKNVRCGIKTGKWQLNKEQRSLQLQFADGTRENYLIQQVSLKTIVAVLEEDQESIRVSFTSDGMVHKRAAEDPFYPANNTWRIKPQAPETNDQIRTRVRDCVHFYALFFKDNVQRHSRDISFIGLPGCFTWYNGGIALTSTIELDKKWVDCFYSEDQALKGYGFLNDLLQRHELKWPAHSESWVSETQSVLEQMYQKL
jgi:hypothetical protein